MSGHSVFAAGEESLKSEHGAATCPSCGEEAVALTASGDCYRCAVGDTSEKLAPIFDQIVYDRRSGFHRAEWKCIDKTGYNGAAWVHQKRKIKVLETIATVLYDRRVWHHVSVSSFAMASGVLPSWENLSYAKEQFVGTGREAYVIFPPGDRYVNLRPVLHLWACIEVERGEVLPRFEGTLLDGVRTI